MAEFSIQYNSARPFWHFNTMLYLLITIIFVHFKTEKSIIISE